MLKNFYAPTPKKMRKLGDTILWSCTALSGMMMGSPLSDNGKLWAIFGLNVLGVAAKALTNLAKEDSDTTEVTTPSI